MSGLPIERFTSELTELFDETFNEVHGHYLDRGTSLFETLSTVSAEEASRPVSARCASIAAQVEHITYYLDVLQEYMHGRQPQGVDWSVAWRRTSVTAEEWDDQIAKLRESYGRLRALIDSFITWDGEDEIGGALTTLVHSAYHLGEIRQALCTVKASLPA